MYFETEVLYKQQLSATYRTPTGNSTCPQGYFLSYLPTLLLHVKQKVHINLNPITSFRNVCILTPI